MPWLAVCMDDIDMAGCWPELPSHTRSIEAPVGQLLSLACRKSMSATNLLPSLRISRERSFRGPLYSESCRTAYGSTSAKVVYRRVTLRDCYLNSR
jgi:hypothetical protein